MPKEDVAGTVKRLDTDIATLWDRVEKLDKLSTEQHKAISLLLGQVAALTRRVDGMA